MTVDELIEELRVELPTFAREARAEERERLVAALRAGEELLKAAQEQARTPDLAERREEG